MTRIVVGNLHLNHAMILYGDYGCILSSGDGDLGFSIWSLPWKDSENGEILRSDYMGNYTFGYLGVGYFRDIDFDNYIILVVSSVGVVNATAAGVAQLYSDATGDEYSTQEAVSKIF